MADRRRQQRIQANRVDGAGGAQCEAAILIVEFARELEIAGRTPIQTATSASRLHLRSILMNSMAFVMGVLPLVLATCADAEMRQAMGLAVFAKMVGATGFEIFLTPVCCVLVRGLAGNRPLKLHGDVPHVDPRQALGGGWGA